MLYSIKVEWGDPQGDNDAMKEALSILGARPLLELKSGRQWLAMTNYTPASIQRMLNRSARGDDKIEVIELPQRQPKSLLDLLQDAG